MNARVNPDLTTAVAAAMDWWRDAGVDCAFQDMPANLLATPPAPPDETRKPERARTQPVASAAEPAAAVFDAGALPGTLPDFIAWWLSEPRLDGGRTSGRVPPRGSAGADVMVIVPEPEREDDDRLLSGPQGRLLDAMLAAMGVPADAVYLASALPRHTPMPDWPALTEGGLGNVLLHHLRLVAPRRLIVLGRNVLPLLGNDPTNSGQILPTVNHEGLSTPVFAATDLALLLARPRLKARVWQQWLDWAGA